MSKPIPLQPGSYYHIYNRGNNRENLFLEERNYHHFLKLYARYVAPVADTYAYCLLKNHFHLLVRIKAVAKQGQSGTMLNPSQQLGHLFNAYSKAINKYLLNTLGWGVVWRGAAPLQLPLSRAFLRRYINKAYGRTGSLFEHPFERKEVRTEQHLLRLITYIHHNPQGHGMVGDFRDWPYSSYHALCSTGPTVLCRTEVLAWFGGPAQLVAAHQRPNDEPRFTTLSLENFD